jgi:hypothetical protein
MRNSSYAKALWGFMGIFLLNVSVDTADPKPNYVPEDLTFNDQESIVELMLEKVLGYENALKEYDDTDSEEHTKKSNVQFDLVFVGSTKSTLHHWLSAPLNPVFTEDQNRLLNGFLSLDTPPPRA